MVLLGLLAIWEIAWKGVALWQAAHCRQTYWFATLLVVNSAGILPIAYLIFGKDQKRLGA